MRGHHFDFVFEDDHKAFFQKVAVDDAGVAPPVRAMTKTAAPQAQPAKRSSFDKVASRLDRDLDLLLIAGPRGLNAGMMKRADAYVAALLPRYDLTAQQVAHVFDKVASAAIQADLEAAHSQLCAELPVSKHHLVDDVLLKIGYELAEAAMTAKTSLIEKLALPVPGAGALRAIGHAAEEGGALTHMGTKALRGDPVGLGHMPLTRSALGRTATEAGEAVGELSPVHKARAMAGGVAETAKGVATAPFRGAKNLVTNKVLKPVESWYRGKIESAPNRLQSALEKEKNIGAASPGLEKHYSTGKQKSLEKQLATAHDTRNKMREGETAMSAAKPPAAAAEEKTIKAEGDRQVGQQAATKAATPPAPKEEAGAAAPKTEAKPAEPPGGSAGKPPGFMDAWHKATSQGWKALSSEERGHLIRGGVTAALVGRAVTGHGMITGGEGLI